MDDSRIEIVLEVAGNSLHFTVSNNVARNNGERVGDEPGIGLKNVLRRLELLYPAKHEISIRDEKSKYFVDLKIHF